MAEDSTHTLIAGRFAVDPGHVLADAGGGLPAYLARDRQAADAARVALLVSRDASPRIGALESVVDSIDNLMTPLGHGVGVGPGGKGEAYYVVCTTPPGPPLSASLRPWPEKAMIDLVLRPIARVLTTLQAMNLTHRAIRLNNVFQGAPGQPVTLGAAWSAPPAMHQPAVFMPPYQAMCHPAARGNGTIGDDVYSLGVLLLVLAGGRIPLATADDQLIIRAKLEFGSFNALLKDLTVSGFLGDLLRGMLAEEPEHRPPPSLLLDPSAARARRVAARPPRRSQRPLMLNEIPVFESQTLAFALMLDEKKSVQALRGEVVTTWLRRGLGDAALASMVEELVRERTMEARPGPRSDAMLVMRCISALNIRMPLCWRGLALAGDGLDGLVTAGVGADADIRAVATELLVNDIADIWQNELLGYDRVVKTALSRDVVLRKRYLQNGGVGGLLRYFYTINPLLPCRLDSMKSVWILNMTDLMRFLEKAAEKMPENLIVQDLAAFIATRSDPTTEVQVDTLLGRKDPEAQFLGELHLLSDLQKRHSANPLPLMGKWMAVRLKPELEKWHNRPRRKAMATQMETLAQAGILRELLELVLDPDGRAADADGVRRAVSTLEMIEGALHSIDTNDRIRYVDSQRFGQAIAGAIGLAALILVVIGVVAR